MRVVLDTNVLMSAIFVGGMPGRILDAWKNGSVSLVLSPDIFEEYLRVGEELRRKHGELELVPLLSLIAARSELVDAEDLDPPVCRDPDDDKFLSCARVGRARALVSGDDDLRSLGEWEGIPILSPRDFVELHLSSPEG